MASNEHEVESYPDNISSKEGSVPTFLKIVYVGFAIYAPTYFYLYFSGDGSPLVKAYNALCGGH